MGGGRYRDIHGYSIIIYTLRIGSTINKTIAWHLPMYVVPRRLEKKIQVVSSSWTSCIMSLVRFVSDHWRTRMDKEQIINSTPWHRCSFAEVYAGLFFYCLLMIGIFLASWPGIWPAKMPGIWPIWSFFGLDTPVPCGVFSLISWSVDFHDARSVHQTMFLQGLEWLHSSMRLDLEGYLGTKVIKGVPI